MKRMIAVILLALILSSPCSAANAPESVVQISCDAGRYADLGTGTLVRVGNVTRIITANHVVSSGGQVTVTFQDGHQYYARRVSQDARRDLALLSIQEVSVKPYAIAPDAPAIGQKLYTAGFGGSGQPLRVTNGPLQQYTTVGQGFRGEALEISGAVRGGDSGGPIINEKGELVGVIGWSNNHNVYGTHCVGIRDFFKRGRIQCGPSGQCCPDGSCDVDDELPGPDIDVLPLPDDHDERFAAIEIKLAALLIAIGEIKGDKGDPGLPGEPGMQGDKGEPGESGVDAVVNLDDLTDKIMERLPGITFQSLDMDGNPWGDPATIKLGQTIGLGSVLLELPE